jgi:uncharacterized protein YkwD
MGGSVKSFMGWTMRPFSVNAQLTTILFTALATLGQQTEGQVTREQEKPATRELTALIEAHNRERTEAKLPPLKVNPQLTEAARDHARDMAEHQKLGHEGSDGSTVSKRVKQRGYRYQDVGENVATGETSERVMRSWLDSPPHRQNILDNFSEIGVAMAPDAEGSRYWCVVFARPWPKVDTAKGPAAMIAALNRARSDADRSVVKEDSKLTRVADQFARDLSARHLVDSRDRDGHTPFDILKRQGYRARMFGLSLASGESDPAKVVKSWLERKEDRDDLLAKYDRVGVAVAVDQDGVPYWVVIQAQSPR